MRALVTGATGFLGAALVRRWLGEGSGRVRCFVRPGSDLSRIVDDRARARGDLELFVGTFDSNRDVERALDGIDVVFHLAAGMSGPAADIFASTVVASRKLLDAVVATRTNAKVVLVSSFAVYGVAELGRGHVVNESTPLEPFPEKRDAYSHAKLRQERLFREAQERRGFPLVVLRPGVVYGPSRAHPSPRVGFGVGGLFLDIGRKNALPLTYVDNCADAIARVGRAASAPGETFNVVDDDLPTCREYLEAYRESVRRLTVLPLPYAGMLALSHLVAGYHRVSKGQLPAVFTPYRTATVWGGNRFDNTKLKSTGWRPRVSTTEGMRRAFAREKETPS